VTPGFQREGFVRLHIQTVRAELVEALPFFLSEIEVSFWAYMLHCNGRYFYVGHTDNLEHRIAQHESGLVRGFASDHRPVTLVWCAEFPTRAEALGAERSLKGWSRAKKMALIRGDWGEISRLAQGRTGLRQAQPERGVGSGPALAAPEPRS
jgi:putative endonuclease